MVNAASPLQCHLTPVSYLLPRHSTRHPIRPVASRLIGCHMANLSRYTCPFDFDGSYCNADRRSDLSAAVHE